MIQKFPLLPKKVIAIFMILLLLTPNVYCLENVGVSQDTSSESSQTDADSYEESTETTVTEEKTTDTNSDAISVGSDDGSESVVEDPDSLVTTSEELDPLEITKRSLSPTMESQSDYFDTSLFTGSFVLTYPIETVKGRAGLEPKVSLTYSSSRGLEGTYGSVGRGWSLNENCIIRDTRYTAENTSDDKFILILEGSAYNLIYVESEGAYHTETESFMKIEKIPTDSNYFGEYWLIKMPDGTKHRFGYDNNSEQVNSVGSRNYVSKWWLDLIEDVNGNEIRYTYLENPGSGEIGSTYLDSITYNDNHSVIDFDFTEKRDVFTVYEYSNKIKEKYLVSNISIIDDETVLWKYNLQYETQQSKLYLTSITKTGLNSTEFPPTIFEYDSITGWQRSSSLTPPLGFSGTGDYGQRIADVNGDGLDDILKGYLSDINQLTLSTWINTGDGWELNNSWAPPTYFKDSDNYDGAHLADVNGDGLVDMVRKDGASSSAWINTGAGWEQNNTWTPPITLVSPFRDWGVRIVDVNGDGLADIIKGYRTDLDENIYDAYINTGAGWRQNSSWNPPVYFTDFGSDQGIQLADINGDGLVDLVKQGAAWINNGNGWTQDNSYGAPLSLKSMYTGTRLVDVNGDGLVDIVRGYFTYTDDIFRYDAYLNTGHGWVQDNSWNPPMLIANHRHDEGVRFLDVNGDGLADLIQPGYTWLNTNNHGTEDYRTPGLLKEISHSAGGSTTIKFSPSTLFDNTGNDSISDLKSCIWVTNKVIRDNGIENVGNVVSTSIYAYKNGMQYLNPPEETEFRGFEEVTVENDYSVTKHYFHQDEVLKGIEYRNEVWDKDGNLYSTSDMEYAGQQLYLDVNLVLLNSENKTQYDGLVQNPASSTGWSSSIEYSEYDDYGNPLSIVNYGDVDVSGDERYLHSEYANEENPWIFGKKTHEWLEDSNHVNKSESWYYYDGSTSNSNITKGHLTKTVSWNSMGNNPVVFYDYDTYGNLIQITDPKGSSMDIDYDENEVYPVSVENALGQKETYEYNQLGRITKIIDSNDVSTQYVYDDLHRITKIIKLNDTFDSPSVEYRYNQNGVAPEIICTKTKDSHYVSLPIEYNYGEYSKVRQIVISNSGTDGTLTDFQYQLANRNLPLYASGYEKLHYYYDLEFTQEIPQYRLPSNPATVFLKLNLSEGTTTIYERAESADAISSGDNVFVQIQGINNGGTITASYTPDGGDANKLRAIDGSTSTGAYMVTNAETSITRTYPQNVYVHKMQFAATMGNSMEPKEYLYAWQNGKMQTISSKVFNSYTSYVSPFVIVDGYYNQFQLYKSGNGYHYHNEMNLIGAKPTANTISHYRSYVYPPVENEGSIEQIVTSNYGNDGESTGFITIDKYDGFGQLVEKDYEGEDDWIIQSNAYDELGLAENIEIPTYLSQYGNLSHHGYKNYYTINNTSCLSYWIEGTSDDERTFVKINQLLPFETQVYSVVKKEGYSPDGESVFLFFDDFSGTSYNSTKYTQTLSSSYAGMTFSNGVMETYSYSGGYYSRLLTTDTNIPLTNIIIDYKYSPKYGTYSSRSDADNFVGVRLLNDANTELGRIGARRYTYSGINDDIYAVVSGSLAYESNVGWSTTYPAYKNLEMILTSNNAMIYVDGTQVATKTYSPTGNYLKLNVGSHDGDPNKYCIGCVKSDTLNVRQYTVNEPTVTVENMGDWYKVSVHNNANETLTDYQVSIPSSELSINAVDESLYIARAGLSPYAPSINYEYDSIGRPKVITNTDGTNLTYHYELENVTITNQNGVNKTLTSDIFGSIVKVYEFNNGETYLTSYSYDALNNLIEIRPSGSTADSDYVQLTGNGTESSPYRIYTVYDLQAVNSNLSAYYILMNDIDASETITWNDGNGWEPIGTPTAMFTGSIDGSGYKIDGLTMNQESVSAQELIAYLGEGGEVKNLGLTNVSVLGSQTDMSQSVHFTYDSLGRKVTMSDPDMGNWTYEYDLNGNLVNQTDARGVTTSLRYDALDRVIAIDYPTDADVSFTYDLEYNGTLSQVTRGSISSNYDYDQRYRIVDETVTIDSAPYTTSYDYDNMDRVTRITYPDAASVNLTYNAQTLLESVEGVIGIINYNARNQITTKELSNGVVTNYTYDAEKLLLDRIYTEDLQDLNYDFDNVGNILEIEDNVMNSVKTYGYDDLDRLTSADMSVNSVPTYQRDFIYDQYGCIRQVDENNATISSYGYIGVPFHAPNTYNGNTLDYDDNGNLIEDEDFIYVYNDANQLSEVRYSGNNSLVEKYWYDANGKRTKKQNSESEFTYDINKFYEVENGIATSYFFRDDERIAKQTAGDMEWYLSDHLGSTTLLINESGLEVERTEYFPYGQVQSGGLEKYGFTGQENDADTGLMYYGARYYSPEYRVFVQPDSMIPDLYNPQALNRYAYALNNPVKYTDPSGHIPALIPLAVGVVMAAITVHSIYSFAQDTIAWNKYEMSNEKWISNSALNVPIGAGGVARTLYKGGKYLKTVNQASKGKSLLAVGSTCGKSLFATGEATAEFIATEGILFTGSQIVSHLDTSVDSTIQENTASGTRVGNALNWGGNNVAEAYDYTSNTASDVYTYTGNTASETYDYASNTASEAYDYASNTASTVTNAMKRLFSK